VAPLPARAGERTGYGGAMPKANPWNKSVPRVELDQPARNTCLWRAANRIMTAIALGFRLFHRIMPGLLLCGVVTLAAIAMQVAEKRLFGRAWLEALVLAILLGTAVRTAWTPSTRWLPGISFSAKMLLEVAVLLLGASVSTRIILAVGPALLAGIVLVVMAAIAISYGIGRTLGLRQRLALLVACGNSICGNSAIAAVAPVIGADSADVASSIAFTAVLGVIIVLALPLLIPLVGLTGTQYAVLAGLTVYAVPQVLAATAPIGVIAVQTGTLVKLVRVLMLGPVVLILSLLANRLREQAEEPSLTMAKRPAHGRPPLHQLVPWFVVGFLGLAALRSAGLLPHEALAAAATPGSGDSSGTEEEWSLAEELYKANKIRNIALFFKHVDARQMYDPGKQLDMVLAFKSRIEAGKRHLFRPYKTIDQFGEILEEYLAQWQRDHEATESSLSVGGATVTDVVAPSAVVSSNFDYWIAEARKQLDSDIPDYAGALFCAQKATGAATSDIEWASGTNMGGAALS
jgi:uncharacterized integral membrane protein (TIGR00698 family)